jgi:hypothetical protein
MNIPYWLRGGLVAAFLGLIPILFINRHYITYTQTYLQIGFPLSLFTYLIPWEYIYSDWMLADYIVTGIAVVNLFVLGCLVVMLFQRKAQYSWLKFGLIVALLVMLLIIILPSGIIPYNVMFFLSFPLFIFIWPRNLITIFIRPLAAINLFMLCSLTAWLYVNRVKLPWIRWGFVGLVIGVLSIPISLFFHIYALAAILSFPTALLIGIIMMPNSSGMSGELMIWTFLFLFLAPINLFLIFSMLGILYEKWHHRMAN